MAYTKQNFVDGQTLTHAHLNHMEEGIANLDNALSNLNAPDNYWKGKKVVINGDSGPAGSGLSNIKDGWPQGICDKLGMTMLRNYSIGGSVIGKRTGDYDECYLDYAKWQEDMSAGLLDTSKKYLVKSGSSTSIGARNWQIYSYKSGSWAGGGTSSTVAGRTPLCDRIGEMDRNADVVVVQCGSNDWYYEWNQLGNFDACTYRGLGYGDHWVTQAPVGEIDTTVNLLDNEQVIYYETGAPGQTDPAVDTSYTAYFCYENIPIIGGRAIRVPKGRNGWFLNVDKDQLSVKNFTSAAQDYTVVAPGDACYLTICFKKEEITPEEAVVYMSKPVVTDEEIAASGKSPDDPCETFYDAMHKMCKQLCKMYRNKDIIIISPIKRRQYNGLTMGTWDNSYPEDKNKYGQNIKDYVDAMKKVCDYYSIFFIDMYSLSGLNPHIHPDMFSDTNGIASHVTPEGQRRMTSTICAQMKSFRD